MLTLHHLSELKKQSFYKEIYSRLNLKFALHVALIFHDIGKKGPKSHSIYGKDQFKPIMYSVVKHGLIGLTKYIATYWHNKNVRCNALSPGPVLDNQSRLFINKLKKMIPLNRLANIDEYNEAIKFLCSDSSKYMTGQNIIIDGGRSIW